MRRKRQQFSLLSQPMWCAMQHFKHEGIVCGMRHCCALAFTGDHGTKLQLPAYLTLQNRNPICLLTTSYRGSGTVCCRLPATSRVAFLLRARHRQIRRMLRLLRSMKAWLRNSMWL